MAITYTPTLASGLGSSPVAKATMQSWLTQIRDGIADLDLRATPLYATRAAAVTAAPGLPSSLTYLMHMDGTALVIRSRSATADDPLFGTAPRWGVVMRQDVGAEAAARAQAIDDVKNRSNHTGTQSIETVDGLGEQLSLIDTANVPAGLLAEPGVVVLDPTFSLDGPPGSVINEVMSSRGNLEFIPPSPEISPVVGAMSGRKTIKAPDGQAATRLRPRTPGSSPSAWQRVIPAAGDWTLVFCHFGVNTPDISQHVVAQGIRDTGALMVSMNWTITSNDWPYAPNNYQVRLQGVNDGAGPLGYPAPVTVNHGEEPHVLALVVKRLESKASQFWFDGDLIDTFTVHDTPMPATFNIFGHNEGVLGSDVGSPAGQQMGRLVMVPRAVTEGEVKFLMEWCGRSMGVGGGISGGAAVQFVTITAMDYAALTEEQRNDPTKMYLVT